MEQNISKIKELADDLLLQIEIGQADWESVEDVLSSIVELCGE